ncbi:putative U-box domain-containing protein 4-like [Capsicum annuum]|uniref:aspartyl protease AED3 n=1 Tax=Capsicum annuum TaxID=4072 RepID=UPI0007BFE66A|nr:aspartyl protease AED3 [Capsicum annuum]KAF3662624.1 putative U-box domain-containing protein 4-like [Capsicum annuum]KAF3664869.1 putative U-box domain-containing protein 4-like [Capsicum annuum]
MEGTIHILSLSLLLILSLAQAGELTNPKCAKFHQDNNKDSTTLQVLHVNSPCSPLKQQQKYTSWVDNVLQMQSKDTNRLQFLASLVAGRSFVPIGSGRQILQTPSYIVKAKIGTPPQTLMVALDNSNDFSWFPCSGCVGCSSTVFASTKSTTFNNVSCERAVCSLVPKRDCDAGTCTFNLTYGNSNIGGGLSVDTFALSADPVPQFNFGCIRKATGSSAPPQGLLALGRGSLSFMSQADSLYKSTFSYCLPSYKSPNFSGTLRLGPKGQPLRIKTTPLLRNPRRSSFYYVNLVGVKVGKAIVKIPPSALAFNPNTGAGTIIDSGTVFTRLVEAAYTAVRNEFRRRMGRNTTVTSLGGFDTCYTVPITIPTITLMFAGMNVTLPQDNFLIRSSSSTTTCLAMAASPADPVNSVLNVIASWQQQNHRILFDVPNSRVGVAREACS